MISNGILGADKIFRHADRIAAWQSGSLPYPVTVELDLTNLCNHACPGCTFSYLVNIDKRSIDYGRAMSLVSELASLGVKGLTFSGGGEPLVYGEHRVLSLAQEAYELGMDVGLITNGSLLRDPQWLECCTWIRVSLDAYDEESFERFHGRSGGEFQKVIDTARTFSELPRKSCTLGVGFLTDHDCIERQDIDKMSRFVAKELPRVDYLQFRPLVVNMVDDESLTGGYASFTPRESEVISQDYELAKRFESPTLKILLSGSKYNALASEDFGRTYDSCLAHFLNATIGADSRVYICCHGQGLDEFCLGDVSVNTFAEVWHGEQAAKVRESIKPREHCPPACRLHQQNNVLVQLQQTSHPNFI